MFPASGAAKPSFMPPSPHPATGTLLLTFRVAIAQSPADTAALVAYGSQVADAGDPADARLWIDRALAMATTEPVLYEAAAAVALRTGDFSAASRRLRRVLASDPRHVSGHLALARAYHALRQRESWHSAVGRAVALAPHSTEGWRIASSLLRSSGRLAEARATGRRAASLSPADPGALVETARAEHALGLVPVAANRIDRALACAPDHADNANLSALINAYAGPVSFLGAAVRRHAALARRSRARPPPLHDPRADRPLRVGYVSADLHDHPVGHTLIGLIEGHDRDRQSVFCYASVPQPDWLTARFQAAASALRPVFGLSDEALRNVIEADRIDILVHVAARFSGNRPGLAAVRAAAVQIAMFDITSAGTDLIDATLSDRDLHPAESDEYFAEPVRLLPASCLFSTPPASSIPPVQSRGRGHITFGSANNPAKWSAETLSLWARILDRLPGARLWLKFYDRTGDVSTEAVLRQRLYEHGLPPDRVDFGTGALTKVDHLAALGAVDVALDPHPFGGATASFEALWMGLPIVTLAGDRLVGRTSAMLLRHAGLSDLVAATPADYVDIACRLATDTGRLQELRQVLRKRLEASPLLDRAAYVATVERAYRDAWASACERHHRLHMSR